MYLMLADYARAATAGMLQVCLTEYSGVAVLARVDDIPGFVIAGTGQRAAV